MAATLFYELLYIVTVHQNNDLFSGWTLGGHVNIWFRLTTTINDFLYVPNFVCLERGESIFNLENFCSVVARLRCLSIQFPRLFLAWGGFRTLKYFEIFLTSLRDLVGIGGDSLSMLTGLVVSLFSFFLLLMGFTLEMHINEIFCLKKLLFLSVKRESHPEL